MSIESILFDLDGTLIDSSAGIEHSARHAVQCVLPGVCLPSLRPFIGPPVRDVFRLALNDVPGLALAENLGRLEEEFRLNYDTIGWRLSRPYPDAEHVLKALCSRDIRCFVVTNKPAFSAVNILRHLGLSDWLLEILCRDSVTPSFPSKAAAVEYLVARHGILPESALFVGDCEDDAHAADRNGIGFVAATYGYGLRHNHKLPENVIAPLSRLHELLAVAANLENGNPVTTWSGGVQRAMA